MSASIESELSVGDSQLLKAHHLGTPGKIYRIRPGSNWFFRKLYLFTMLATSLILVSIVILGFRDWRQLPVFLAPMLECACLFFMGVVGRRTETLRLRSARAIVCEHGLLQIRERIRNDEIEIVFWTNILGVRKQFAFRFMGPENYLVTRREGKVFVLDGCYENIGELLSLIQRRSRIASIASFL